MDKLEQIKCLCDVMKDTECDIDWDNQIGTIYFGSDEYTLETQCCFRAEKAKEDLTATLQDARDTIAYYENVAMRLEALLLLKVFKEDKE